MENSTKKIINWRVKVIYALICALPFLFFQLAFLINPDFWNESFDGGFIIIGPVVFFGWIIYLWIEIYFRKSYQIVTIPAFSIIGISCLISFFVPAKIVKPILLKMPSYCVMDQSVEWQIKEERKFPRTYNLIFYGNGNSKSYLLIGGYLNLVGNGLEDYKKFRFKPLSYQKNNDNLYKEVNKEVL